MTEYKLELTRVSIEFEGDETRYLNIEIFRGDEWLDSAVLTKEDILWLLGENSDKC
jgi:hypothetical protein